MADRYELVPNTTKSKLPGIDCPAKPRNPIRTAIPIVRELMEYLDKRRFRLRGVIGQDRIYKWRSGKSGPQLQAFIDLAARYNFEVMLVPKNRVAAVRALLAPASPGTPATPQASADTSRGAGTGAATAARTGQQRAA
jgi:hypothetical protein